MFWEYCETESIEAVQRFAIQLQGWNHRNFPLDKFLHEGVFFKYGGITPARRAIELRHQRRPFFHADLIHAVLIAVERQQAAITAEAHAFQRIQYAIGSQRRKIFGSFNVHILNLAQACLCPTWWA